MLFNSYEFLLGFLPIVFAGFFVLARFSTNFAAAWLAAASLYFYAYWDARFLALLIGSIIVNFVLGSKIAQTDDPKPRKLLLICAVTMNLMLLAYFKYANFFLASVSSLTGSNIPMLDILLPMGISFFTFTQIAFLADAYKGIAKEYNPIHYVLFVTYFPHLIAGPVLHHKQMMPQFKLPETYRINWNNLAIGLTIFAIGLFKKVVIADNIAPHSDTLFLAAREGKDLLLIEAWTAALAYTLQLYFDFSGYSDMAIGLSRLFNVKLPLNFDSPYRSLNISEFWRRWHMTLSAFLRDYLYIPLGGNRSGHVRRYANLMTTMVLGGLWHGANWTFVVWGALHGFYLVVNHGWQALCTSMNIPAIGPLWLRQFLAWLITFLAVVVAWVFFRAESFAEASIVLKGMIGIGGVSLPEGQQALAQAFAGLGLAAQFDGWLPHLPGVSPAKVWLSMAAAGFVALLMPNTQQLLASREPAWDKVRQIHSRLYDAWKPSTAWTIYVGVLLAVSILGFTKASPFLYFQF